MKLSESQPPQPVLASYSGIPLSGFDTPPAPPALELRLVEAIDADDRRLGLMDVRLYNLSDHGINISISRDGKRAYELCGAHILLDTAITWKRQRDAGGSQLTQSSLYGCDLFAGSTLTLMTNEFVTLAGLAFTKQMKDGGLEGILTYSLDEAQYSHQEDKLKVVSRGLYYIKYK